MSDPKDAWTNREDSRIELSLRAAVSKAFKHGEADVITLRSIRETTIAKLELEADFFKTNERWKAKSKQIIENEVVCCPGLVITINMV